MFIFFQVLNMQEKDNLIYMDVNIARAEEILPSTFTQYKTFLDADTRTSIYNKGGIK